MNNCRVRIRILANSGTQCWITEEIDIKYFSTSQSGYYYFKTEDGRSLYYPVANTIIEEI
jgi:hypothetical protein